MTKAIFTVSMMVFTANTSRRLIMNGIMMKLAAPAKTLAAAVRAACLATTERSPIAVLAFARLTAGTSGLAITGHNLDQCITTIVPAEFEDPGETAARATALVGLAEGLSPNATVTLEVDGPVLAVRSGRSRYRLPTIPVAELPPARRSARALARLRLRPLRCEGSSRAPLSPPRPR